MNVHRTLISGLLALCVSLLFVSTAQARSQRNLAYRGEIAWTTAVRLLRVDMGFTLDERDSDARFVLFQYNDGEHRFPGSLEIVERQLEDGRLGVRVIVSVPAMPSYVELHLIDRLERKLRDEVGPPLPIPTRVERERRRRSDDDDEATETADDEDSASEEDDN